MYIYPHKEGNQVPRLIDLSGQVFGHLTVLSRVSATGQAKWLCRCKCGAERTYPGYELRNGHIKSCGCQRGPSSKERNTTHGMTRTPTYQVWVNMRNRCYRPEVRGYERYGGAGIAVCESWRSSFEAFLKDMGPRPVGFQLDRIDPTGDYSPSNCRWVDINTQANNKKRVRQVTINGITRPVAEWCRVLGLPHRTIRARIYEAGWDPVKALTVPIR